MFGSLGWVVVLLSATFMVTVNSSQPSSERLTGMNPCISKQTCHECIQTPHCAWCAAPNFKENRCFLPNVNTRIFALCPEEYNWNPDNVFSVIRHSELTKGGYIAGGGSSGGYESSEYGEYSNSSKSTYSETHSSSSGGTAGARRQPAVQISPQEVNLKLRINEAHRISFAYLLAEDYPVDLYYLMDLSKSMEDDKTKLSDLAELLVESMSKITSNFSLGFGSFVDKVVMPYVSTVPKALLEPCPNCTAPYGYKHVMSLSTDTSQFADLVRNASVSGNLDAPEGGFDAIMQAIVCLNEIGWRHKTRRLLVFSTNAGFHYAGDGKLGGIVKPNDGSCHLDAKGFYTHSSKQDYPSISQINRIANDNKINIIWAVTEEQISIYERLTEHVQGSYAGILSNDSSNVVDLIREQYNAISTSLQMQHTASSAIKIRYFSSCLDDSDTLVETSKCDGLKVGSKIEFIAEIEVNACPANRSEWKQRFNISPVGVNEALTVNLEMLCDCECEHKGHAMYEENSPSCSGTGTLTCGVCECNDGFFGKKCECNTQQEAKPGSDKYMNFCRPDNTSLVDCSGRGICTCGTCDCTKRDDPNEVVEGTYCECDNFSCPREENLLCSGHGRCVCGQCVCYSEWTGSSCNCPSSESSCIAPGTTNGVLCSGHGDCVCGKCNCYEEGDSRYSGKYCEKPPRQDIRCEELNSCVQCQVYKIGNYSDAKECDSHCKKYTLKIVKTIDVNETIDANETINEQLCIFYDEDDCKYSYVFYLNGTNELVVRAREEPECPIQVYLLGIVLGVIGAIVLIGLALLLLWKLLTTIHDRREFARFEKERMMAKWDTGENPIYKQATSTFKNPTYAGK